MHLRPPRHGQLRYGVNHMKLQPTVFLAALAISAAGWLSAASAGAVLTGAQAFGDWSADSPGTRRLLKPRDQPPPSMEEASANSPSVVAMPRGATLNLPKGFKAEMVASGISNPRAVRVAPNGDIFVADSQVNQLRVYRLGDGAAKPVAEGIFAKGLHLPYGIAFYPPGNDPQWLYVAHPDGVVPFPYRSGDLEA